MSSEDRHNLRPAALPGRHPHVGVFRPGRLLPAGPVVLDQRTGREIFGASSSFALPNPTKVWESITEIAPTRDRLARNGLFAETEQNPATAAFDMLRTRVLQVLASKTWTTVAITSPTHGCGKSFAACNLALSLARLPSCRTVLVDLELRRPNLAHLFGQTSAPPLIDCLMGERPLESSLRRIGRNLALALNGEPVPRASELLQDPEFAKAFGAMKDMLQPDVILLDTPPALASDDVIALAPHVDAVLLVTDGTRTSPEDIRACERLFQGRIPLLGVVLNRAQDRNRDRYNYGQR